MARFRKSNVRVAGLKELQRNLLELPKAVQTDVMERTLLKNAEPFAAHARQHAPVLTGHLKQSIAVGTESRSAKSVTVAIGPGRRHGFFQEFGTAHHAAQPFLRPAWDALKHKAVGLIAADLRAEISRAAARMAARAKGQSRGK